ncbi:MAG: 2-oxoglutarate dehydrogenase E1 component [Alphaproteobacteria bacterium]|nr:2-oxoglutarate dehydrogenase E1 component [Alphaproteobacteria bacterium]
MSVLEKEFLFGESFDFISSLYKKYLENQETVPESWRQFFQEMGDSLDVFSIEKKGPSWQQKKETFPSKEKNAVEPTTLNDKSLKDSLSALMLVQAYRALGHLESKLDPLGLMIREKIPELDPKYFGFKEEDWDRQIFLGGLLGFEKATLRDIYLKLRDTYCSSFGVEFSHIIDSGQKEWIQEHLENDTFLKTLTSDEKINLLKTLLETESFENFLDTKYKGAKRFGLEGCDALIPCLKEIIEISAKGNVENIIFGMAHRGRLNVLANILQKPLEHIFKEFSKKHFLDSSIPGSGDVKYHLGYSSDYRIQEQEVHLSLTPNPSHLESVDSVVLGRVRAEQDFKKDDDRKKVLGILIHGDAAFPGQGVVAECFGLSNLEGYKTGGTIHLVINNQVGFTTSPHLSRSSPYCSDLAKSIGAPVFHVNADDPEMVIFITRLAVEFRKKFQKDVVIDIIGYRRFGHNETDDPSFTQPTMYEVIAGHLSVKTLYEQKLLTQGFITKESLDQWTNERKYHLEDSYKKSEISNNYVINWMQKKWENYKIGSLQSVESDQTVDQLKSLLKHLIFVPKDFAIHKRMDRILGSKKEMVDGKEKLDWGTAESLAFATILKEGHPIRLSGQDSGRGTFSQRHNIWTDQKVEKSYIPLNYLETSKAKVEILNSPLSEFAVLGYEYGYSFSSPKTLILWEAQFGDFANGAQVIIDQFISSAESKWHRLSGLVMLLPHGYEGQGPEHSSARLERYLQLCAEENMHVAYCSTPANYYHILRRQILGPYRKPLILMTPKSLLRHPLATSFFEDLSLGTKFSPVLTEEEITKNPLRIVICSGKVYYDLLQAKKDYNIQNIALIRLEEFYPFPEEELIKTLKQYAQSEVIWCQEEPENMGAWFFVDRRLESAMKKAKMKCDRPIYVGRKASASPSTGFMSVHEKEQNEFIKKALLIG